MKEAINKAAFIGMIVFNIAMFFTMKNDYWYLMYLLWGISFVIEGLTY